MDRNIKIHFNAGSESDDEIDEDTQLKLAMLMSMEDQRRTSDVDTEADTESDDSELDEDTQMKLAMVISLHDVAVEKPESSKSGSMPPPLPSPVFKFNDGNKQQIVTSQREDHIRIMGPVPPPMPSPLFQANSGFEVGHNAELRTNFTAPPMLSPLLKDGNHQQIDKPQRKANSSIAMANETTPNLLDELKRATTTNILKKTPPQNVVKVEPSRIKVIPIKLKKTVVNEKNTTATYVQPELAAKLKQKREATEGVPIEKERPTVLQKHFAHSRVADNLEIRTQINKPGTRPMVPPKRSSVTTQIDEPPSLENKLGNRTQLEKKENDVIETKPAIKKSIVPPKEKPSQDFGEPKASLKIFAEENENFPRPRPVIQKQALEAPMKNELVVENSESEVSDLDHKIKMCELMLKKKQARRKKINAEQEVHEESPESEIDMQIELEELRRQKKIGLTKRRKSTTAAKIVSQLDEKKLVFSSKSNVSRTGNPIPLKPVEPFQKVFQPAMNKKEKLPKVPKESKILPQKQDSNPSDQKQNFSEPIQVSSQKYSINADEEEKKIPQPPPPPHPVFVTNNQTTVKNSSSPTKSSESNNSGARTSLLNEIAIGIKLRPTKTNSQHRPSGNGQQAPLNLQEIFTNAANLRNQSMNPDKDESEDDDPNDNSWVD